MDDQSPPITHGDRERAAGVLGASRRVMAAVLGMRRAGDLGGAVGLLWGEMRGLEIGLHYCGLDLIDEAAGSFQFYGSHPAGILRSRPIPLAEVLAGAPPGFGVARPPGGPVALRRQVTSARIGAWIDHLNARGGDVRGFALSTLPAVFEMAEVPFAGGSLAVARAGAPFIPGELEIFAHFADLVAAGYSRFLDFERLERQNRALRLANAVDEVQQDVGRMERSHDWGRVVRVLCDQLTALGVGFASCSINVIDEAGGLFRQNLIVPRAMRKVVDPGRGELVGEVDAGRDLWALDHPLEPGVVPSPDAYDAWREGRVLIRRLSEEERERRFLRSAQLLGFAVESREDFPRATLDVPFSHGLIALTAPGEEAFSGEEVAIVRQFAQVIETGYRRWLDIRQLAESNRVLGAMNTELEARNRDLGEMQAQVVQSAKMAAMGELVAGVAHEINTPLGAIKSMSDVVDRLLARLPAAGDGSEAVGQARELLAVSQSAVERIAGIVRDLRTFARLDEAELQDADLHQGIESTLNLMRHEMRERVEVVRDYGELPRVRCYPNRMNQVFMNLLKNAVQAIDGSGTITIRTRADGDRVRLAFADTGRGIPPEHVGRIFDPGFTTKGVGVGTGLGLSIVSQIMAAHGGRIAVESVVGTGSTFILELPLGEKGAEGGGRR